MANKVVIDVGTGRSMMVPLDPAEQADYDARVAAFPAQEAARQALIANGATLAQRAQGALAANTMYLALAAPTAAQQQAQLALVTKECSAIIRLFLGQLDSLGGA